MRGRVGLLSVVGAALVLLSPVAAGAQPQRQVILILLDGLSYRAALAEPALAALAGAGGVGLMTTRAGEGQDAGFVTVGAGATAGGSDAGPRVSPEGDRFRVDVAPYRASSPGAEPGALGEAVARGGLRVAYVPGSLQPEGVVGPAGLVAMDGNGRLTVASAEAEAGFADLLVLDETGDSPDLGGAIRSALEASRAGLVLVLVVAPEPSATMVDRGDTVTPFVAASGDPGELLAVEGALGGLTSDTTRRDGVVANVDVAPTVLDFLGLPIPEEMDGSPVGVAGDAPAGLHERFLAIRRIRLPVEMLAAGIALGALATGLLVLALPRAAPGLSRAAGAWALAAVSFPIALVPVTSLPRIAYGTVLPTAILLTVLIVGAASWWGRGDPTEPPAIVAGVGVGVLALDAARGWPAMVMPVIGGGTLEGARFFGLGNTYAGYLLAGGVLVAAHLPPLWGVALLAAGGLLAGLPWLGSNLGAAVTLFVAAGLWYGLRVRRRLGVAEAVLAAAAGAAGAAALLLVHGFLAPATTHVGRVAEAAVRTGPGEAIATAWHRLGISASVTSKLPVAWVMVAALPAFAALAWRRFGYLSRDPAWRDAALTLSVAAMVGFVVNDTGIGVAGISFAFLCVALAYPALEERWMSG